MKARRSFVAFCLMSFFLPTGVVHASDSFPDVVRQTWDVESLGVSGKGCVLCHTNEDGGSATVQRPFGVALSNEYGVRALNVASLRSALREMQPTSDVDGDGVTDYEELLVGTDLNFADAPEIGEGDGGAGGAASTRPESMGAATGAAPKVFPMAQTGCAMGKDVGERSWCWLLAGSMLLITRRRCFRR